MKSDVIETRNAKVRIDENGIVRIVFSPGAEINLEDVKEFNRFHRQLGDGKKTPLLNDIREVASVSRDARLYTSGDESREITRASAIFIGSPVSRVIGNFFLGINKPPFPTKLFTSEDEAIKWLKGFLDKE